MTPERKAAERLFKMSPIIDLSFDEEEIAGVASIIRAEHEPLYEMLERMVGCLGSAKDLIEDAQSIFGADDPDEVVHKDVVRVLDDYAAMKKEWEGRK